MSATSVQLLQPTFTASGGNGDGDYIDQLRSQCGYVVQAIDWVCRHLGFDLIAHIIEPISGDFGAVEKIAAGWAGLGTGLAEVGANYSTIAKATPTVWEGEAAGRATQKISQFAHGADVMGEAAKLISRSLGDVLEAAKAVGSMVAMLLSEVDDAVLKVATGVLGWAKELATGGETIRKIVGLVLRAIHFVETLKDVVPPLLKVFQWMRRIFEAMHVLFAIGEIGTQAGVGYQIDDVAKHGFQG